MTDAQEDSTFKLQSCKICEFRCYFAKKSILHFHCPVCRDYAASKAKKMTDHIKSKHGETRYVPTNATGPETEQTKEHGTFKPEDTAPDERDVRDTNDNEDEENSNLDVDESQFDLFIPDEDVKSKGLLSNMILYF